MSSWALITGLVRNFEELQRKVDTLNLWKQDGFIQGIVFSTWIGEIELYEGLGEYLRIADVFVVESTMPNLMTDGHVLHQMKSLAVGLEACPDDAWIFKLRSDMVTLNETIKTSLMKLDDMECEVLPGWPNIFGSRILVHGGLVFHPLFLNDIIFMGRKRDLMTLASGTLLHELFGLRMNPEQVLFSGPMLEHLPIFGQFFRVNPGIFHGNRDQSLAFSTKSIQNPFYLKVFSTYLLVLSQYFRVGFYNRTQYSTEGLASHLSSHTTVEDFLSFNTSTQRPFVEFFEPSQTLHFYSDYWVSALLKGLFASSPLLDQLNVHINAMKDICKQDLYAYYRLRPEKDALEYGESIASLLPEGDGRRFNTPVESKLRITAPSRMMNVRMK